MLTLIGIVVLVTLGYASRAKAASPVYMTERGSGALVWLANHPRPGTARSRAALERRSERRVWRGLRLAGVYYPFLCLHSHEGAWNSNTGNGYWGGLQFDSGFYHTYGMEYVYLWGHAGPLARLEPDGRRVSRLSRLSRLWGSRLHALGHRRDVRAMTSRQATTTATLSTLILAISAYVLWKGAVG